MDNERDLLIFQYFREGLRYRYIVHVLSERHGISVSLRHLNRILRSLALSRRDYSDSGRAVDFVISAVQQNSHGYRIMRQRCLESGLRTTPSPENSGQECNYLCIPAGRRFYQRSAWFKVNAPRYSQRVGLSE